MREWVHPNGGCSQHANFPGESNPASTKIRDFKQPTTGGGRKEAAKAAMEWVEAAIIWRENRKLSCKVDAAAVLFWLVFLSVAQFVF